MSENFQRHVMLDLETLGQGPDSVILSIGAVAFEPDTGLVQETCSFYANVNPQSCVDLGMKIDASTVLWWMQQSDEARAAVQLNAGAPSINRALMDFAAWFKVHNDGAPIWGNGSDFDNVILANAYRAASMTQPWKFWNNRCFRTLKNLHPGIKIARSNETKHNALHDAIHQAYHAVAIFRHRKGGTP